MTFIFKLFVTLLQNFKAIPSSVENYWTRTLLHTHIHTHTHTHTHTHAHAHTHTRTHAHTHTRTHTYTRNLLIVEMFNTFWPITCLQTRYFFFELTLLSPIFSCFSLALLTFSFILSYFFFSLIIALSSSWLISMSINAWNGKVWILSSLLLPNRRILSCFFFLFLVIVSNFLIIPVVNEKN